MPELVILLLTIPVIVFFLLLILTKRERHENIMDKQELPFVSILIAIRNEAENIENLCDSLNRLTYPKDRYEILLADDHSEDNSRELMELHGPGNATIYTFGDELTGKQACLIELVEKAKGEFFLLTDGDMTFNTNWIEGMLYRQHANPAMQCGITAVDGKHWFARLQNLDWLLNQFIVGWFSKIGIPLTAWGNNLIIDRDSYNQSGGFAEQAFTIVEDVALFKQVLAIGGVVHIQINPSTLTKTQPIKSLGNLLHQRKRWLKALGPIPWWVTLGFGLKLISLPLLLCSVLINHFFGIILLVWGLFYWLVFRKIFSQINLRLNPAYLLYFLGYELVIYFLTFAIHLLPIKTKWKGRYY